MHLQIIIGSIRQGRRAKAVGDWAYALIAERPELSVELIDLKEWGLPMYDLPKSPIVGGYEDPLQQRWADKIAQGDAYLFVSPEYNHGYSAVLKNAIDYIYGEWMRKPASFITYGSALGARGGEQLRLVMVEMHIAPLRDAVHIAGIPTKIGDGKFTGDERDVRQLHRVVDELLWWGRALKAARAPTL